MNVWEDTPTRWLGKRVRLLKPHKRAGDEGVVWQVLSKLRVKMDSPRTRAKSKTLNTPLTERCEISEVEEVA